MIKKTQLILITLCILCAISLNGVMAQSDTATYTVTFNATWTNVTHPHPADAFPAGAHYSGLIGAIHNENVTLWEAGGIASAGIKQMAETGGKATLTDEINGAITAGTAVTLISESGTDTPDTLIFTIDVDAANPLVTIVTMIAPSPDWFAGVSGLSLRSNDTWTPSLTVDLFPYDAGTEDGDDYKLNNSETNPQGTIASVTGVEPFSAEPVGTLTFELSNSPTAVTLHNGTVGSINMGLLLTFIAFVALISAGSLTRHFNA